VGLSRGLIGGGGSILATPLPLYVVGVTQPHIAIGTGAVAVSATAFINLASYARARVVRWRSAIVFAGVGTLGAFIGSSAGKLVDGNRLLFLFALVMLAVGVMMLRPRSEIAVPERDANPRTSILTAIIALSTGAIAGFFGIGGGFLIVPGLLLSTRMPMINAVGSSLLAVGCFGLATTINYAFSGLVDWAVAGQFIIGGIGGGLLGIKLASRLSRGKDTLKRIFAGVIFLVAAYVLYRSWCAI
jgi:uncharacterized membrane protein YfcA